jgi:hypothetical protein
MKKPQRQYVEKFTLVNLNSKIAQGTIPSCNHWPVIELPPSGAPFLY